MPSKQEGSSPQHDVPGAGVLGGFTPTTPTTHNHTPSCGCVVSAIQHCLTKREFYAGMALQGIAAGRQHEIASVSNEKLAQWAFTVADAMLKEGHNS